MKKILLLLLFLFMPIFINAQTCNKNDIVIKSVIFDSTSGNASEKSTPVINGKSIKLDLNMNHVNDIVTYKVVIENNSKNNYEIEKILGKSNYIEYVFEDESSVIESNTTKELHLKAIYRNEVPSNLLNNGTYNDSDDIVLSLSTLVNPKTGYTFILFIIVLGVIGLIINLSLNNQNAIKSLNLFIIMILLIPAIIYADCKVEVNIKSNVEIKKIAIFDTGISLNRKMIKLASPGYAFGYDIYSFKRSNEIPNSVVEQAQSQIEEAKNITVSDSEVNEQFESLMSGYTCEDFYKKVEDGVTYYCEVDEYGEYCDIPSNIPFDMYSKITVAKGSNTNQYKFIVFDKDENDFKFYNEDEIKTYIRNELLEEKKSEVLKNVFSSPNSDSLIYGWFDNSVEDVTFYYYSESEEVYLNKDSSGMFYNIHFSNLDGIENINTSKVEDMSGMFYLSIPETFDLDLSAWDTSNVKNMSYMFSSPSDIHDGVNSHWKVTGLENWDTSKVTNMSYMFKGIGYYDDELILGDFSSWDISSVVNMRGMFLNIGNRSTKVELVGLENWDTSNVIEMSYLFDNFGNNATSWNIGNISSWNTSNVRYMSHMFAGVGSNTSTWNIGDLSEWDTSNVITMNYMFSGTGQSASNWKIESISGWNTSNVEDMSYMFYGAGYNSESFNLDLSRWNTSKVKYMNGMFSGSGFNSTSWSIGDISRWNTSNVEDMSSMFMEAGNNSNIFNLGNLSNWKTSKVTDMSNMFIRAGSGATTWYIGDLSGWDTSNVIHMSRMFYDTAKSANIVNLDLSNWKTSKVDNMTYMFYNFGRDATSWSIGNISSWNTSKVENMSYMFYNAGSNSESFNLDLSRWNTSNVKKMDYLFSMTGANATEWSIGDLSGWNTSNVENMSYMFYRAGQNAESWSIGNLSSWDTHKVGNMSYMFRGSGQNSTTWNNIGTLKIYATNLNEMFRDCKNAKATLNIYNNPTAYDQIFINSANGADAQIVVNYTNDVTKIDSIVATKSSRSNVIKGEIIESP